MKKIMQKSKAKTGRKIKPLVVTKKLFEQEQLNKALFYVEDLLQRCVCPFMLLDDIAKAVFENQVGFKLAEISLGIRKRYITRDVKSMMLSLHPDIDIQTHTIYIKHEDVPIVIWIIHNDLDVFKYPDFRFYSVTEFNLPNPFYEYWNKRDLIK